ncbi:MAG: CDP-glycerol glycerophosphotransferase family protein [Erysipelotrichaceae bacterium]|nr:CDP-glycerol glycerophosphotransferase family protein [Erysipelotrichaceae bacterium]
MKFIVDIMFLHLRIVYFFMKFRKVNVNKIVMLSRQSEKPSMDFLMLKDEILKQNPQAEVVMLNKMLHKNVKSIIGFYLHMYTQLFHMSNAYTIVVDTYCIPVSMFKHQKDTKVIQIWHSAGAIKKFGLQTTGSAGGRGATISKAMRMHQNYDVIVSSSDAMIPHFAKAFGCREEQFVSIGLPRIDYLIHNEKSLQEKIYAKYPQLKEKPVVLYVPTFRRNRGLHVNEFFEKFDYDKYHLVFKHHPLFKTPITDSRILTIPEFSSLDLVTVADKVISDYSAISIEVCALDKPLYLYLYDYDEYTSDVGVNIELKEELKDCVCMDADSLIACLDKEYPMDALLAFKHKYLAYTDGSVTSRLAKLCLRK